jgi:ankyrin repeat protein
MLAVEEGHLEATKVLLDARANVNVKVEKTAYALAERWPQGKINWKTTLRSYWLDTLNGSRRKANPALVQLLLANGADKNARTKEGMSASSIAAKLRNQEIISLLK